MVLLKHLCLADLISFLLWAALGLAVSLVSSQPMVEVRNQEGGVVTLPHRLRHLESI